MVVRARTIEDGDLGVGHGPQVPGLDVGLVLAVAVAASGAASHLSCKSGRGRRGEVLRCLCFLGGAGATATIGVVLRKCMAG